MKKILILFCVSISLFPSCKKNNSGPDTPATYHISCMIDGVKESFNVGPQAKNVGDGTQAFLEIMGSLDSTGSEAISIGVTKNNDFNNAVAVGTYSDTGAAYSTYLGYSVASISSTYQAGNIIVSSGSVTVVNHLKLVITSIDATGIKGTFSGDVFVLYLNLKKTITNGDFYIKLS